MKSNSSFVECVDIVIKMKVGPPNVAIAMAILLLCNMNGVLGIRFVIDREECFSHYVQYEGDAVHASFVVISVTDSTWHLTQEGLDLTVSIVN